MLQRLSEPESPILTVFVINLRKVPMQLTFAFALLTISLLSGCATTPATPPEAPISVQLRGTSVEVQQFIEERLRKDPSIGLRVESATDRAITFKTDCMNVPKMNALSCAAIMMAVGNKPMGRTFRCPYLQDI